MRKFKDASGRTEAVLIAQQALQSWQLSPTLLEQILYNAYGKKEGEYILNTARRLG
jgi:hypothetical protein